MFFWSAVSEGVAYVGNKADLDYCSVGASRRANELGKTLVVVGCCGQTVKKGNYLQARIGERIPVRNDGGVILCGRELEKADDIDAAWAEMCRVAGQDPNNLKDPSRIWISTTSRFGMGKYNPKYRWIIEQAPPVGTGLKYKRPGREPYLLQSASKKG